MKTLRKRSKFNNKRVVVDGVKYDSKHEYKRYCELLLMEKAGEIKDLQCQVKFSICPKAPNVKGSRERFYIADFVYTKSDGTKIIEDAKSPPTKKDKTYRLKKQLVQVKYPEYVFVES